MDLFVSTFINKIDKKGRVSQPSIFRSVLPKDFRNEIILSKSLRNNIIDVLSVPRVKEIASRINELDFFSEEHEDFTTSIFSEMLLTNHKSAIELVLLIYNGIDYSVGQVCLGAKQIDQSTVLNSR